MSEWKKVKLGDLYTVHNGLSKSKEFFGSGYPFLTFSNVFNNWFLPDKLEALVQSTDKDRESFSIQRGDIFITRTSETMDELGMSSVALKDYPNATFNGFTKRLRPKNDDVLPEYIGYYLRSKKFRNKFLAFSSMTTRASLANSDLLDMEVEVPEKNVQRNIANILSRYDSLIENYQKQIKLLEESAQRLYKDWFVDLRFPGYENTKFVDGVPEGWEKKSIAELGSFINGFAFKPSDWHDNGLPIIKIKEMGKGISIDTPRNNGERVPEKYLVTTGDLLFSWSATLMVIVWAGENGWLNQHLFKVIPKERISREFVLQSISNAIIEFSNLTTGSTMKHIQRNKLDQVFVNVPCAEIMQEYNTFGETLREQIINISSQIHKLTEARDRLLPKLMSGEIEV
ncbi:restriction endonuclease subunit S [Phocaeicola fibrisolvens]|uniref:restriction endonuclease subunit S n=1 Tax=Phocaeicola fibrisolvens TaxID=2981793 RepID=UPI00082245F7|nr:restriction endonuclease subunit S [Phocaeicola fibrisolvens]MCU6779900.1 restriction endonuclease subunit S [Phocaeicola fibrisolvens]SCI57095.1 EcoKI restriction-modification system protein HsdS [uncultured Bacteroides sp.]